MANKLKYRKAWSWPQRVEDFIASQARGFTIHVMNGNSKLGDLRIDKYSEDTDIRGDALALPLKDEVADTVICDPPWAMDDRLKIKLLSEIRRILKFGGLLILNATWSPKMPGMVIEEILVPEWQLMTFHHIALIFKVRKVKGSLF